MLRALTRPRLRSDHEAAVAAAQRLQFVLFLGQLRGEAEHEEADVNDHQEDAVFLRGLELENGERNQRANQREQQEAPVYMTINMRKHTKRKQYRKCRTQKHTKRR